ncbi:MAG: HupE/UreJ family protein, partial [Bryobacteraceae bacterium]
GRDSGQEIGKTRLKAACTRTAAQFTVTSRTPRDIWDKMTQVRPFLATLLLAPLAAAHTIPNDVTVHAFFRPDGQRLRLLVRVPLKAMRDVEFPLRGPGYLDLERAGPILNDSATIWIANALDVFEDHALLPKPSLVATRVSLQSDKSFDSFETALAHLNGPKLTNATNVAWDQVLLDTLLEYPIQSDRARFSIHSELARLGLRTVTVLRFLPPGGAIRAFEFTGDPGVVELDPRWHQAALRFVKLGFLHILDGTDHLLFLLCLVIPFRRFRALVPIVTAFTVAHSITLIASAYNFVPSALWFPPLIETLIAASILYMALENIVGGATVHRRWIMAFGFGLVHGFGFSFALKETLQFAGSHLLTSLLGFNIGVELGQLLVLAFLVPAIELLFRYVVAERMGTIILSALVAHTAWHWMIERADQFKQFRFEWPIVDAAMLAIALRVLTVIVLLAGLWWAARAIIRDQAERKRNALSGGQPSGGEQPST